MGFASELKGLEAGEAALGRRVYRPGLTTDLAAIAANAPVVNLFRITVGNVLITHIYGIVTTGIGVGATEIELWHTPAAGPGAATPTNLCTDSASIANAAVNRIYTIDGSLGGMTTSVGLGVGVASFGTNMLYLVPGIIALGVEEATNTGIIDWILHYVPLRLDARVSPL